MSTPERIASENAGAICRWTSDDRPALADLYRVSCLDVAFREFAADLNDATIPYWYAFKDERGEIRVAMLVWNNVLCGLSPGPTTANHSK
jgi:hypothetical protein